jgi:hypothetical protein
VAFASSLLGLAGSLIVGLLELFVSHGQNRFYRELEEWMSTITRVGFAGADNEGTGEQSVLSGVIDHMGVQMDGLQQILSQSNANRAVVDEKLGLLADAVARLTHRMEGAGQTNEMLRRVAEGQEQLIDVLAARPEHGASEGLDAESRMRLRSIDVQMLRILEEISAGRQETMTEIRTDLSAVMQVLQGARAPGRATLRPTGTHRPASPEQEG